jgi:hypothetical protein
VAKFDQEDLLDSILDIMTTKLNARISAIEAEKAAKSMALSPTLAPIASDAYYLQSWSEKILTKTPAIFYGVEDVTTEDGGGAASKRYKIFCEVIYCDNGQRNDAHRRIARYARALEEIFAESFRDIADSSAIKIETVRPISFKLELDSSEEIKVGGVSLSITLV